jgi:Ca2+/Na+ antiporter
MLKGRFSDMDNKYRKYRRRGFIVMLVSVIVALGIMMFWLNDVYFKVLWPIMFMILFSLYTKYTFYLDEKQHSEYWPAFFEKIYKELKNEKSRYERIYMSLVDRYNENNLDSLFLFKEIKCICRTKIQSSTLMATSVAILVLLVNIFKDMILTELNVLIKLLGGINEILGDVDYISTAFTVVFVFTVVIICNKEMKEINKMRYIMSIIEEVENDATIFNSKGESLIDRISNSRQ